MAVGNTVRIIITGDAKDALKAFGEVDVAAGGMGTKLASVGKIAAVAGVAVAAGIAGAGVALFKIGETFDEAYDKIRVGTGAVGEEFDGLKSDLKSIMTEVPATASQAADALTAVFQKLGNQTNTKEITEQFLELARITKTDLTGNLTAGTDALNNWGVSVGDQAGKLDLLFRASQQSGVAFADLSAQMADNGVVLRGLGFNFDQAATVMAGLGRAGIDVSSVMPALSKTLTAASKAGKEAGTVYQDTIRAIKDAPDQWTANAKAIEVFGAKAGPKFAEMIRQGQFAFDNLGESIAEGTDTIIAAGKETQDFGEKWQLIKNRIFVALEPLAMKVFDGMGKAMDKLGPIITEVANAFGENGLAGAFKVLKSHFDNLDGSTKAIIIGIAAVGLALWAALSPVTLIIAAIAALAIGLVYAYNEFDTFRAVVDTAAQAVMTELEGIQIVVAALLAVWEDAFPRMQRATELATRAVRDVNAGINEFLGVVGPAVDAFAAGWVLNWQLMSGALGDAYRSTIGPILGAISAAIEHVLDLLNSLPHGNASGGLTIPTPFGNIGIPGIPRFAGGGMVPGTGPKLIVAHGGEQILTRSQQGGSGLNIEAGAIVINGNASGQDIVEAIVAYERRSGTRWRS